MPNYKKQNYATIMDYKISQNFMTSGRLIERIVNLSNINKKDIVFEVGTGKGHITKVLSEKCGYLYSVEIDPQLIEIASGRLSDIQNLSLINKDFLKYKLPEKGTYKIFSNIPYFITTQILDKLTQAPNPAKEIWLVVEKGVANRFIGIPRETTKSLLLKPYWNAEIIYRFKKEDFHPKPSVDSVLLHLSQKEKADVNKADLPHYKKFVEHSMKHGLLGGKALLTKVQVSKALQLAKLPPLYQDRETLYIEWLCLFRCYKQFYQSCKKR